MKYLLDTESLLLITINSEDLSEKVKILFLDEGNKIYVSLASLWEISLNIENEKINLGESLQNFIHSKIVNNKIEILQIEPKHLYNIEKLPKHHTNQFERMLIAQSIVEKIPLITRNKNIAKYAVERIWN